MPLDHFISQVHLKNFYSPILVNRMYAIRKTDLKAFTPDAHSVCRIEDGSTNVYLEHPRAIEEFLKGIEPRYNRALSNIASDTVTAEDIYVLSGFISYILTCSPAGMRLQNTPLRQTVEETGRILDKQGKIPKPPAELGGSSLRELLDNGTVKMEVDPKYPQAMGISGILRLTNTFGNFYWDVLINNHNDSPFFSSDFPIAIEETADPTILNKIIPLSPTVAIRIRPDLNYKTQDNNFEFPGFRRRICYLTRNEVRAVNTLLVQCAETMVFFRDDLQWVQRFVQKNANFCIESRTQRIPTTDGTLLWSTQKICTRCS